MYLSIHWTQEQELWHAASCVPNPLAAGRLDSFFKPAPASDKPPAKRKAPEPKAKAGNSKKVKAGAFGGKR